MRKGPPFGGPHSLKCRWDSVGTDQGASNRNCFVAWPLMGIMVCDPVDASESPRNLVDKLLEMIRGSIHLLCCWLYAFGDAP